MERHTVVPARPTTTGAPHAPVSPRAPPGRPHTGASPRRPDGTLRGSPPSMALGRPSQPPGTAPPGSRARGTEGPENLPRPPPSDPASTRTRFWRSNEGERCRVCTKHQAWTVYDVFLSLATPPERAHILRDVFHTYISTWYSTPGRTLFEIKVLRRSGLYQRFRSSAQPVAIQEWFTLCFPNASAADLAVMLHWARLREIQLSVSGTSFRGTAEEVRNVFEVLDFDKDGNCSVHELARAEILTKDEVRALLAKHDINQDGLLDQEEFCSHMMPFLKAKFLSGELKRKMEREQEMRRQHAHSKKRVVAAEVAGLVYGAFHHPEPETKF